MSFMNVYEHIKKRQIYFQVQSLPQIREAIHTLLTKKQSFSALCNAESSFSDQNYQKNDESNETNP